MATACSESAGSVRKNNPFVLPSRAMLVNVGEVDAAAATITPFSIVTEVRRGPVIPEEIGPTSARAPSMSMSFEAASTATEGWDCESRTS